MKNKRFSTVEREILGVFPAFPVSRAHLAQQGQQSLASHPQIGQRKQRHDLPRILRQTTVANLHKAKLAFHHTERVFNNCPHRREHPVERLLLLGQRSTSRFLGRRQNRQIAFFLNLSRHKMACSSCSICRRTRPNSTRMNRSGRMSNARFPGNLCNPRTK